MNIFCQANRGVCVDGMESAHRETKYLWRTAATGCPLHEDRLRSTQQFDHPARKAELGVPCEQASGSQARNVIPHYKQLNGRDNIRTHSRPYTHQRQHTLLLTTFQPHRSLQTVLLSEHHQDMEQKQHTTVS